MEYPGRGITLCVVLETVGQVRISVFSFAAKVTLLCKLKKVQNKAIKMM